MSSQRARWYPLDHSAKIWPAVLSARFTSLFRLSAVLSEAVVLDDFRRALDLTWRRYPYFSVEFHRGLFWYYLEEAPVPEDITRPDRHWPCMDYPSLIQQRRLLRVYLYGRRVSLEVSHVLTDGMGAMEFLRTLVYEYLRIRFSLKARPDDPLIPRLVSRGSDEGEWVDSYLDHGLKGAPLKALPEKAFHLPFRLLPRGEYRIITGHLSLSSLQRTATEKGVSVTEYLVAVLFLAFQDYWTALGRANRRTPKALTRPIRILVPVNLRGIFESRTMRNFFVYVDPEIDPRLGEYSFDDILKYVHHYLRGEKHRQNLRRHFARHARTERTMPVRMIPLWIKNMVLSFSYQRQGDSRFSTSLSNIGAFRLPAAWMEKVDWVDFYPPPSPVMKQAVSIVSCNDVLSVNFGKMIAETPVETRFFRHLVKLGHQVEIQSNYPAENLRREG
jgi:hypothetical protein